MTSAQRRKVNRPEPPFMHMPPLKSAQEYGCVVKQSEAIATEGCKGLFADRAIGVAEILAEFGGALEWKEAITDASAGRRDELSDCLEVMRGYDGVFLNASGERGAFHAGTLEPMLARYANDAKGTGLRPNARIARRVYDSVRLRACSPGVRFYIVATRELAPGEEILVSYGAGYSHF